GRFVQPDPIGLLGGTNLYVYGDDDPIDRVDAAGTSGIPPWLHDLVDTVSRAVTDFGNGPGAAGRRALTELDLGVVRPVRDSVVGTSGPVVIHPGPGGLPMLPHAVDVATGAMRDGEVRTRPASAAEIRAGTLRNTEAYLEPFVRAAELVPGLGTPAAAVRNLVEGMVRAANGDPRALVSLADLARGPLGGLFPSGDIVTQANDAVDWIQGIGHGAEIGADLIAGPDDLYREPPSGCGPPGAR
ncbi:MAG TPA: hypothetical protein VK866_05145, partial [Acidimicrobiales bacterium]|nr:hypothetical protein [Acidimicrobiales bacterium]